MASRPQWARLYLQMAPSAVVCEAFTSLAEWNSLEAQDALARLVTEAECSVRYRQRVLKPIVAALQKDRSIELSESLIELYMEGLSLTADGSAAAASASAWSCLTFDLREGTTLRLRTRETVGGGAETGCVLWDAARALSAWLLEGGSAVPSLSGLQVIELGAGPGLVGLCVALCSEARLSLTDVVPETLDNLRHNAALLPAPAASRVDVRTLDWLEVEASEASGGQSVPGSEAVEQQDSASDLALSPDLIVAADVVYEPSLVPPLIATIRTLLCRRPGARALVAAERRGEAWGIFLQALRAAGLASTDRSDEARASLRASSCPFWCAPEAIERIHLLEITGAT